MKTHNIAQPALVRLWRTSHRGTCRPPRLAARSARRWPRRLIWGALATVAAVVDNNTLTTIGVAPASQPFASQPTVTEGAIDADGERLLAGEDRYATSVLLASVPLDAGDAGTDDLIVVSGESLVDAVSAVSVAAARDAAIVLTQSDGLPDVVRDFVADRGFDTVTIGGGTAAVTAATADALAELTSGEAADAASGARGVERVEGATRYETAVAAARAAGDPGAWCDTAYRGAMVVSGESLVDGVIAAPVAYAWRLPLLFTEPDALPEVVDEFLNGVANVRHVTVVGAPADINPTVVDELARSNDIEVLRIDANTPAERSVELAEEVAHCRTQPVAPGQYALLDANQPVDGVAAAAALANGLGEHGTSETLIPVLAVNQNSLPQPVADYLANVGRRHDTITLYPLGGVARLTPRVITRAVNAAQGNTGDDADDDAADAGVDVSDAALIAAGLTPGKSDGTGVAVGVGVVVEGGVMRLEPPAGRIASATWQPGRYADALVPAGERVDYSEWLARPGVLDPYLWQPEIEVREAGVDHDGDGQIGPDERYPLGSPERAAYMVASGGQAPPGAMVLAVPDMTTVGGALNEGGRSTAARYPAGIPVPPGAPDRLTTTFEQRQLERKQRFEAYSGGSGVNAWDIHYFKLCELTPEGAPGSSSVGVPASADGITCETAADWYLWMCDTMNSPALTSLNAPERWLETFRRFYAQWESQLPAAWLWHESLEEAVVTGPWRLDMNSTRGCTYTDRVSADQARSEVIAWGSQPDIGYSQGNNRSRQDPDSGFWDSVANRFLVVRNVSENEPRIRQNGLCRADVRYCYSSDLSSAWNLRAFEGT